MTLAMQALLAADPIDITKRGAGLGWVGGIVVTAVAIAAILLVRNMNKRIRRLPGTGTAVGAPAFEGRVPPAVAGRADENETNDRDGAWPTDGRS